MTFEGSFKFVKSDNYNEYLKLLNVSWFKRKQSKFLPQSLTVEQNINGSPGTFRLKSVDWGKTEIMINLGEAHDLILPNGDKIKAVTVMEGDNTLITRTLTNQFNMEIRREFQKSLMIQTVINKDKNLEVRTFYQRLGVK